MSEIIKVKKGLDIPLKSHPTEGTVDADVNLFAIYPSDYPGYTWKVCIKESDKVLSGSPILFAKESEEIKLCSPVSGEIYEIKRGERRKIEYISIKKDNKNESKEFDSRLSDLSLIKEAGFFALIRQRPYDIVPDKEAIPTNIFITAFDSTPLAPEILTSPLNEYLEEGIRVLKSLTTGTVYLGEKQGMNLNSKYAEVKTFSGPHPAGNVGTQMAAISPINKGETVWTMDATTACRIGKLLKGKKADYRCQVAITGPEVEHPTVKETFIGAKISELIEGCTLKNSSDLRYISGNVLTGNLINPVNDYLHYPFRQITIIKEGNHADEFMGWASINPKKYSTNKSFPAFLRGLKKPFEFDARIKGGKRAMIMSGEYDKVFPMDIYPEYLIKAILSKNIERMEELGIYEVAPEDFALAEFVDSSKLELQKIVREGLDYLRKETT